jgi:hypothetical protein
MSYKDTFLIFLTVHCQKCSFPRNEIAQIKRRNRNLFRRYSGKFALKQGSLFRSENDIYPPPLLKMIFFPFLLHIVFPLPSWPFCLNSSLFCNYFFLLLPLFSFSFPFLPFSFFFLPFSFTCSPFFSSPFHIFSPNSIG